MAAKKTTDFTGNAGKDKDNRVMDTIQEVTSEPAPAEIPRRSRNEAYTEEEIQTARAQGRTQGRKGVKAVRINMAFAPDVHQYIKVMARARGESVTEFTNFVFRQSMQQNADLYEQAKSFVDNFKD